MERTLCLIFIFLFALLVTKLPAHISPIALISLDPSTAAILTAANNLDTKSSFDNEEFSTTEILPYETKYGLDENLPCGEEEVNQVGKEGKITRRYRRVTWQGEHLEDELLSTDYQPVQDEIIALGIKPGKTFTVNEPLFRPGEKRASKASRYNCILKNFWATSYDGDCAGCSGRTHFTGEPVDYGLCAVDPDIIRPLSSFYIPGYGRCKAADQGGGLGGKHIDLGFDDVKNGWWHAKYTDIYLLR